MLDRETSREKNLEKNAKEARAKARKEAARTAEPLDHVTDEDLAEVGRGGGGGGVFCYGTMRRAAGVGWGSRQPDSAPGPVRCAAAVCGHWLSAVTDTHASAACSWSGSSSR